MPTRRRITVVDAPSNLGLRPPGPGRVPGCWRLPEALRANGIVARLGGEDGGRVTPPAYAADFGPGGGRNVPAIAAYSTTLADRLGQLLDAGAFPLVLGGDCSILLGALLALRRRGRHGLAFVDGHLDFRHPGNTDRLGGVAGEDLAVATGRGPAQLTDLEGRGPLVEEGDVVALGHREPEAWYQEVTSGTAITCWTAAQIRELGAAAAAERAVAVLGDRRLDGFWIHLDVDVLDGSVMPAVDSPGPGGLTHEELTSLFGTLAADSGAAGADVAIFDPDLDPDGHLARELTDTVAAGFGAKASQ
jgi:arginase